MTIAEMIEKLEGFARQSDDGARAEEIVAAAFRPDIEKLYSQEPRDRQRIEEVRPYITSKTQNGARLREEAYCFRQIAAALRNFSADAALRDSEEDGITPAPQGETQP